MSRRISTQKRFPLKDFRYDSFLVNLLLARLLREGKKTLARSIVYKAFDLIELRTTQNPLLILERAVRNVSPRAQLKAKRIGGTTYQIPSVLTQFKSTALAIRWLVKFSQKRSGKSISIKLANELIEAAKGSGQSVRKKEETHKMAEANKAFAKIK